MHGVAHAADTDPTADPVMLNAGFLDAHPDLNNRLRGMDAYRKGEFATALRYFMRAAYYADKPSQAMVAEMHSLGQGTSKDLVLAYVWMDMAAERGYLPFLGLRERYWDALSDAERERVSTVGGPCTPSMGTRLRNPGWPACCAMRVATRPAAGSASSAT